MRRRLLALTAAVAAATVMSAGTAGAARPGDYTFIQKTSDTCTFLYAEQGHWIPDFNPSDFQRDWRTNGCGTPTSVSAGLAF